MVPVPRSRPPKARRVIDDDHEFQGGAAEQERCPSCGFEDTRDAFECLCQRPDGSKHHAVICPNCEADHPDQTDHDDPRGPAITLDEFRAA